MGLINQSKKTLQWPYLQLQFLRVYKTQAIYGDWQTATNDYKLIPEGPILINQNNDVQ
jgi:hypothetical protein